MRPGPSPHGQCFKKAAPRSRGAAAPTRGQSARLGKEQPGETHAFRVAHRRAGPLTARHGSFRPADPSPRRRPAARPAPVTSSHGKTRTHNAGRRISSYITPHFRNAAGQKKQYVRQFLLDHVPRPSNNGGAPNRSGCQVTGFSRWRTGQQQGAFEPRWRLVRAVGWLIGKLAIYPGD